MYETRILFSPFAEIFFHRFFIFITHWLHTIAADVEAQMKGEVCDDIELKMWRVCF
jgi:hypothetical protein